MPRTSWRNIEKTEVAEETQQPAKKESQQKRNTSQGNTSEAVSERESDMVALESIGWTTLVLGQHYPEQFDDGNWTSQPGDDYPIDIVLGLYSVTNVYKIILNVAEDKIPSRVDVAVGLGDVDLEINYQNAREADFKRPIVMAYHQRERSHSRMESKVAYTDTIGQYVWLQVHEPINHKSNPLGQIGINKLTVLGYPLTNQEVGTLRAARTKEDSRLREEYDSKLSRPATPAPNTVTRYSYNGDGMRTSSGMLGGYVLTTLRTVKRTLTQKKESAKQAGRDVEATICLRAVQRLTEYEAMVEDLTSRRSNALARGETDKAERFRLSMIDCRDTALRSIQVDLLLNRPELRSIGVASEWTEQS